VNVALLQVWIIIVEVPVPVVSVLWDRNLQPGFEFPTVVDDRGTLKFISSNAEIMAKPKDMPSVIQRQCSVVKGKLTQWQASWLP